MKLRFLSVLAAAALLAACETGPTETQRQETAVTPPPQTQQPVQQQVQTGPAAGSVEEFNAEVGDRVFFDFDKAELRPDARATLDKQIAWLKQYPNYAITIEGHADERGTREYNLALGERRANAVKDYMVAGGIPASRIRTVSFGKERPVCLASNEACWSQNRRGVTVLR